MICNTMSLMIIYKQIEKNCPDVIQLSTVDP